MKIKVEYEISLPQRLIGYVDNNVLHFRHLEGIFKELHAEGIM